MPTDLTLRPAAADDAEAVAQIRGEAGERQIADCDLALCHGNGGTLSSQCTAILGSEAVL